LERDGSPGHGDPPERLANDIVGGRPLHFGFRLQKKTMVENARRDLLHVVGSDKIRPVQGSARLCRGKDGLVYVLTVLGRDGKVARITVDAAKGNLVGGR